jgi:hypothetical protein
MNWYKSVKIGFLHSFDTTESLKVPNLITGVIQFLQKNREVLTLGLTGNLGIFEKNLKCNTAGNF